MNLTAILKKISRSLNRARHRLRTILSVTRMTQTVTGILTRLPTAPGTLDKYSTIAAYVFLGGMVFFLSLKVVPNDIVTYKAYYLWDKGKDCLFIFCLLLFCEPLRRFLFIVFIYSLIRLLWQIFITITNEDINDIRWINVTWLTLASYMTYLCIKEMLNRHEK